jgi:hypothetical protein
MKHISKETMGTYDAENERLGKRRLIIKNNEEMSAKHEITTKDNK